MGETVAGATNALFERRYAGGNNEGYLRPAWVGYGLFADLADSLPSLSAEDRNLLALTAYAVTYCNSGDYVHGDWERVGIVNFLNETRIPDGRSLAEVGCTAKDLQAVSFTVAQASEALGYKSPNGAQKIINRALEVGRLYVARRGRKGHATLYVIGPIVWEPDEFDGVSEPIIMYSILRKSNTFMRLSEPWQSILRAEGPEGVQRRLEESLAGKAEVDRIMGVEGS